MHHSTPSYWLKSVAWISNKPFHHMQWPPYSADMSIIGTVWGLLKKILNVDPLRR